MGKVLLILLFLSSCVIVLYSQNDYRDGFMGRWIWHNDTDTFRIKFKKGIIHIVEDIPCLYGYHEYKTGNKVLESSLKNYDIDTAMKLYTIKSWVTKIPRKNNVTNLLVGSIRDVEYRDNIYMYRHLELTLSEDKKSIDFLARDEERIELIIEGVPQNKNEIVPEDRSTFFSLRRLYLRRKNLFL